jgi:hypothetical protein
MFLSPNIIWARIENYIPVKTSPSHISGSTVAAAAEIELPKLCPIKMRDLGIPRAPV